MLGHIKRDKLILSASAKRELFVKEYPNLQVSQQLINVAKRIAKISERKVLVEEESGLSKFFKRILSSF